MELCSDGHDEVCYDGRSCPVCDAILDHDATTTELAEAEKEIERLKDEITELKYNQ